MAGDGAVEAVGEAVQQDEREGGGIFLKRQQRPGAAADEKSRPGDAVGGDPQMREPPPEGIERRIDAGVMPISGWLRLNFPIASIVSARLS